MGNYVKYIC